MSSLDYEKNKGRVIRTIDIIKKIVYMITIIIVMMSLAAIYVITKPMLFGGTISSGTIVVFGNTVNADKTLSKRLQARLDEAIRIAGSGKQIIVSGGTGKEGHNEAVIMAHYLQEAGIQKANILIDPDGYSTSQTCDNIHRYTQNKAIIIVSQRFHLARAGQYCKQSGLEIHGYSYPSFFERRDIYSFGREVFAIVLHWFSGESFTRRRGCSIIARTTIHHPTLSNKEHTTNS